MNRRGHGWIWLLAGVLLFIWGNSLLPAEVSGAISGWLHGLLKEGLPKGAASGGDRLLRKIAHFTEFALLGAVLLRLLRTREARLPVAWLLSLACGIFAACLDELLQHFSPGRSPQLGDVCIDAAGVLTGTLLCLIITIIGKSKTNKSTIGGKQS